ncbi:MAG: signal peptidase II [Bacilli bacterium]
MKRILILSSLIVLLDQLVKFFVSKLVLFESIKVINDFFSITYVQNEGAAFSILSGNRFLLIFIALVAIGFVYFYLLRNQKLTRLKCVSYGLLLGGIVGNLIDRICYGYVIDYLDFRIFSYSFPIFNIADIAIVIAMFVIAINIFEGEKNEKNCNK